MCTISKHIWFMLIIIGTALHVPEAVVDMVPGGE
jgi:hypothetical protein